MVTKKLFTTIASIVLVMSVMAQKLNTPNRTGPMGLEVNTYTGNLFFPRTDGYIAGRGIPIDLSFYYNSALYEEKNQFGKGWRFNYSIYYVNDTGHSKIINWGEGREDYYVSQGNGKYLSPTGFFDTLSEYQPGKFRLRITDGTTFFFDNAIHKKITRIEDPNGNFLSFSYTDSLLSAVANNAGQTVQLVYTNGLLTTINDQTASPVRTYQYSYDDAGNLVRVTDPLNNSYQYEYIVNGPLKSVEDRNQNKVNITYNADLSISELIGCNKRMSFTYDSASMVSYVTDYISGGQNQVTRYQFRKYGDRVWLSSISGNCCGFDLSFEFDDHGNKIRETDGNGQTTYYTYDNRGNVLTVTDPLNNVYRYTYSPNFNKITSFTDPKGFVTTMEYDNRQNLIKLTEPGNRISTATYNAQGDLLTSTDPKGNVVSYSYDSYGNPILVTGSLGSKATMSFDGHGNLLSFSDSRNNTTSLEYDILDRVKKITDPLNQQLHFTYDASGNTTSVTNEASQTKFKSYDASHRLVQITGPTGKKSFASYDAMDNLSSMTDEMGNSISFGYDSKNRLSSITNAEGNRTLMSYDGNGNITSIRYPNGSVMNYTYDALNRVTRIEDEVGKLAEYSYDRNGNVISVSLGSNSTYSAEYDSLNRMKKLIDPLGNNYSMVYDGNDNITSLKDRNGQQILLTFDSLDRVKTYTDENGAVVTASYDLQGNITSLKDQNNNTTTYLYDNLDRVTRMTYPDGRYIEYTYDLKGNIINKRMTDGTNIQFGYDTLNRLVSKTLPGGVLYQYQYDDANRMIAATNANGTVLLAYDNMNRVISETYNGRKVTYQYDVAGRRKTIIYPDSTLIVKTFDTRNRLTGITRNNISLVSYQYNLLGQLTNRQWGNGLNDQRQYDFANRLSSLTTASGLQSGNFTFSKEQRKQSITRSNPALSEQFNYDNGNRLTGYQKGSNIHTYQYDALGNRLTAQINGTAYTYTSNNLNQLTQVNNGVQTISRTYDNNGNLTFDGKFYKTYDAEGKILKDSASPTNVITYEYDALNRRTARSANGVKVLYTFSGLSQIEERLSGSGVVLNKTVFAAYLNPVLRENSNGAYYYHSNDLHSIEAISNAQGRILEKYEYDPYGKTSIFDSLGNPLAKSLAGNPYGFTGQWMDSSTGVYRFYYRDYDPSVGLFNQRDPIYYTDGMGMYQYVHDDPANGIDLLGLKDCPDELKKDPSRWKKIKEFINFYNGHFGNLMNLASIHQPLGDNKKFKALNYTSAVANIGLNINLLAEDCDNISEEEFNIRAAEIEANLIYLGADVASDAGAGKTFMKPVVTTIQTVGKVDAFAQEKTGKSLSRMYSELDDAAQQKGRDMALKMPGNQKRFDAHERLLRHISKKYEKDKSKWRDEWKEIDEIHRRAYEVGFRYSGPDEDCPENNHGGSRKRPKPGAAEGAYIAEIINSLDPNEIIGPEGVPDKAWVSVNDRLPYTINYENEKSATAPAKFVKIVAPVPDKIDPATFQLGSFGFNSLTFTVPAGTAAYYQRLDCRDSLSLYVDVTAGYDPVKQQAFWEFQSIDPTTLLPPADPLKGFLLRQDSNNIVSGHGFVTFSVKPVNTAHTLDSILARADIVFDSNDTIPTNIARNTIDAVAPTSSIQSLVKSTPNTEVNLQFTGSDDPQGSGLKSYSIYVSDNNSVPELYIADFQGTDTSFIGVAGHTYKFYVSAIDSVGNKEALKLVDSTQILSGETRICPGGTTVFDSKLNGSSYQWQVNTGSGFVNISNNALYSGANTSMLTLTNAPTSMYGYVYRCIVNNFRYSNVFLLKFEVSWNGTVSTQWENPANWTCNATPDENTDVVVNGGKVNYPVLNSNATIRTLRLNNGATATVNGGFTLTLKK